MRGARVVSGDRRSPIGIGHRSRVRALTPPLAVFGRCSEMRDQRMKKRPGFSEPSRTNSEKLVVVKQWKDDVERPDVHSCGVSKAEQESSQVRPAVNQGEGRQPRGGLGICRRGGAQEFNVVETRAEGNEHCRPIRRAEKGVAVEGRIEQRRPARQLG